LLFLLRSCWSQATSAIPSYGFSPLRQIEILATGSAAKSLLAAKRVKDRLRTKLAIHLSSLLSSLGTLPVFSSTLILPQIALRSNPILPSFQILTHEKGDPVAQNRPFA
jgi:hypothetical protein